MHDNVSKVNVDCCFTEISLLHVMIQVLSCKKLFKNHRFFKTDHFWDHRLSESYDKMTKTDLQSRNLIVLEIFCGHDEELQRQVEPEKILFLLLTSESNCKICFNI